MTKKLKEQTTRKGNVGVPKAKDQAALRAAKDAMQPDGQPVAKKATGEELEKLNAELHQAAKKGDANAALEFIAKGANVNSTDFVGRTPLMWFARYGNTETAQILLDKGADPNVVDYAGKTALTHAALANKVETVRLLISNRADVKIKNMYGETLLMEAAYAGSIEAVEVLIAHGAGITVEGNLTYNENEKARVLAKLARANREKSVHIRA